jgi:type II secretory pathway component PulJ
LASNLGAEIARWFESTQRLVDRLAEAAQQQEQLKALVAALERDNEQLRREVDDLRTERAGVAEVLRALVDDLDPTQSDETS